MWKPTDNFICGFAINILLLFPFLRFFLFLCHNLLLLLVLLFVHWNPSYYFVPSHTCFLRSLSLSLSFSRMNSYFCFLLRLFWSLILFAHHVEDVQRSQEILIHINHTLRIHSFQLVSMSSREVTDSRDFPFTFATKYIYIHLYVCINQKPKQSNQSEKDFSVDFYYINLNTFGDNPSIWKWQSKIYVSGQTLTSNVNEKHFLA